MFQNKLTNKVCLLEMFEHIDCQRRSFIPLPDFDLRVVRPVAVDRIPPEGKKDCCPRSFCPIENFHSNDEMKFRPKDRFKPEKFENVFRNCDYELPDENGSFIKLLEALQERLLITLGKSIKQLQKELQCRIRRCTQIIIYQYKLTYV